MTVARHRHGADIDDLADLEEESRFLLRSLRDLDREFEAGDVDLDDYAQWTACVTGPGTGGLGPGCAAFDFDGDLDIDLIDYAEFQLVFTGWP